MVRTVRELDMEACVTLGMLTDEQAVRLVEYQRAYESTAKLVTILDQLSQETIDMIR